MLFAGGNTQKYLVLYTEIQKSLVKSKNYNSLAEENHLMSDNLKIETHYNCCLGRKTIGVYVNSVHIGEVIQSLQYG